MEKVRPIDPVRATQIATLFAQVRDSIRGGRLVDQVVALGRVHQVERLALEIADREYSRAERAEKQALLGGIGALVGAVLLTVGLLRRERSVTLAAARTHAEQVQHMAEHDSLTGLPNRRRLDDHLDTLTDPSSGAVEIAVCDLNDFRGINDRLGHHAGDSVLITAARDLQAAVTDAGTVYRTGGDEFCIVSKPGRRVGEAARRAFEREERGTIGSVGVATWPSDHELAQGTVRVADRRMYAVKRATQTGASQATVAES